MKKRVVSMVFLLVIVIVFPLAVFSMGTKETVVEPSVLHVGLIKGPTGIGAVHIIKDPHTANKDIDVQLLPSADGITAKLLTGELDFAVLPVNLAVKLYNSGIDYVALAVVGNGMVQLLTSNPGIATFSDLAGKTVYIAGQGATPEYVMRAIAGFYKIPMLVREESKSGEISVRFNMPYPEMAGALAAGKIETAVLPEPFATIARIANPGLREPFSIAQEWQKATGMKDYPMTLLIVRASLAKNFPGIVKAFALEYEKSIKKVLQNTEEAGKFAEELGFGLKAAVASTSIARANYVYIPAKNAVKELTALLEIFLKETPESIGGKLPDASFYDPVK